ncbi:MAG: CPBP family intramembrane metalloprotease [Bacteroidetes bacterium]|nr:CPBP family intramembrane metalloprotease [Bacteroidota bacterium]
MTFTKKLLYQLGVSTLIVFSLAGAISHSVMTGKPFMLIFESRYHWTVQVFIGAVYGWCAAYSALWLIRRDFMTPVRTFFTDLFMQFKMTQRDIIFISFCAGVGEEIAFRGGMQPSFGILFTSLLFVSLHGYLNPFNWRLSVYGLFMCVIILGIGVIKEMVGLTGCISAHFVIDWYLLTELTRGKKGSNDTGKIENDAASSNTNSSAMQ